MQPLSVTFFGFLEFIGTTELLVVLFVALLVFGPRKLPEFGRSLGRVLNQVRAASDDFKRTWEADALLDGEARAPWRPPLPAVQGAGGLRVEAAGVTAPGTVQEAGDVQEVESGIVGSAPEALTAEANA